MEITFTRTTEYMIEIDAADEEALSALRGLLTEHGIEGDTLADQVSTLHAMDVQDALMALCDASYTEVAGDSAITDSWDCDDLTARWGGPEDDDESDDGEPTTQPLTLPAFVTGEGFVPASLT